MRVAKFGLLFSVLAVLPVVGMAAASDAFYVEATFKADKQRELSQLIAKAYLSVGERVRTENSRDQLQAAVKTYRANQSYLEEAVKATQVQQALADEQPTVDRYLALVAQPYSRKNAAEVIGLSEALLQSDGVVLGKIEGLAKIKPSGVLSLSVRQGMLAQRIAKFYVACKAGICTQANQDLLKHAVGQFDNAQAELLEESKNNLEIGAQVVRTQRLWQLVRGLFLNARTGHVPVMVSATADMIADNMDRLGKLTAQTDTGIPPEQLLAAGQ